MLVDDAALGLCVAAGTGLVGLLAQLVVIIGDANVQRGRNTVLAERFGRLITARTGSQLALSILLKNFVDVQLLCVSASDSEAELFTVR